AASTTSPCSRTVVAGCRSGVLSGEPSPPRPAQIAATRAAPPSVPPAPAARRRRTLARPAASRSSLLSSIGGAWWAARSSSWLSVGSDMALLLDRGAQQRPQPRESLGGVALDGPHADPQGGRGVLLGLVEVVTQHHALALAGRELLQRPDQVG